MNRQFLLILLMLFIAVPDTWAQNDGLDLGDTTLWYNRTHEIKEVTVKGGRSKYSRKNNPAVELMKKVVAAKKRTNLHNRDYYSMDKYQKITLAANDVTPEGLQKSLLGKVPGVVSLIETCPSNGKLILPFTYTETATRHIYRKKPREERDVVVGERTDGITTMMFSGEILTAALKDFFTDVDIYDDQVRLFQHPFTSPIGKDAVAFYRFYIQDTVYVDSDRCIQLHFSPNNLQDFGFSGELYVMDDTTYQVKRCELSIPRKSGVNFVERMSVVQDFTTLPTGERVLTVDDMTVELALFDFIQKGIVTRTTRLSNYSFDSIPDAAFSLATKAQVEAEAKQQTEDFWESKRKVELTGSEKHMSSVMDKMKKGKAYKYIMTVVRLLVENYLETGFSTRPSKFDIGPINTFVTSNFIDGFRLRIGGQTTANFNKHLFLKGYYAHGFGSKHNYYNAEVTYSFNPKAYLPDEFPRRTLTLSTSYDVCSPSDKFMGTDKDNVFNALKWTKVDKMMFYRRHQLTLEREERNNLRMTLTAKIEENEAAGNWAFVPMPQSGLSPDAFATLKTAELRAELRYAPGEKFVVTKQRRRKLNNNAPIFTLSHSMGFSGVLGGQYRYNMTDVSVFRRFWLKSWGSIDLEAKAGAQWNQVPFLFLCMPAANLSYITNRSSFGLINNMEFVNDRYASLMLTWDINGKLFNRIPLLKRLKWREYVCVRSLWGTLTDKNNPLLSDRNSASGVLMELPDGSYVMDSNKPYVEIVAGVHNVFRFFHVEYVRRLNYLSLPTATKQGIRIKFSMKF